MFNLKGIVPQLVEQYNDFIEQNLIQNELTYNQNIDNNSDQSIDNKFINNNISGDSQLITSDEKIEKVIENSSDFRGSIRINNEVLVEINQKVDQVLNEEIIEDSSEVKVINNENDLKLNSNELIKNEEEKEIIPIIIALNPILEDLMVRRKHCFVTKTIVPKEICGICSESIKFSEKYIQCINCIAMSHLNCTPEIPLPCIPYTNPNLRPSKMISNYVYPAFKPSIPAILIHCCREVEKRSHESSLNGLYVMKSEALEQVKDLCDKILKSKNGFPLLRDYKIDWVCGVVKKFLSDFNESLIGIDMWKQFSYNMRKKDDEQINSLTMELIMELNKTNRDTLSFLVLHLQHLANNINSISLEQFSQIFCPIICGETEEKRKLRLMSSMLCLNSKFWIKILMK